MSAFDPSRLQAYLEGTHGSPPRGQLVRAVERHCGGASLGASVGGAAPDRARRMALDIGCGPGREVCYLLEAGFDVVGFDLYESMVEATRVAAAEIVSRTGRRLELSHGSAEELLRHQARARFALIHAGFVLPFIPSSAIAGIASELRGLLAPSGILVGQLFGPDDSFLRASPAGSMNAHTSDEVAQLLDGFDILEHEEVNREGCIGRGRPKWWHVHHIVARRR